MRRLAPDLWIVEAPLRFLGAQVGRRMTVVRLPDGTLWLHSVSPLTDELGAALAALGTPAFAVAASALHGHRFMEQYRARYPDLELIAAPGLDRRRKDLAFDGLLGSVPDPRWAEVLDQMPLLGHLVPEVVFLHRPSRTLIVGDLVVEAQAGRRLSPAALLWRLDGVGGSAATPRSLRWATRNRTSARRALERMLAWDFDRIVTGHGRLVETGGHEVLRRTMAWL